ncbi:MAG: hypothetical protein J7521_21305 [Caulobacter sp.]|nr:hypothetical protein [Caulobacter sp.]
MSDFSIFHWLVILGVLATFVVVPCGLIFKRAGWSPWVALLTVLPGAGIVLLWVFALARWPSLDRTDRTG